MRVVIAGGSGFLGRALQNHLRHQGHVAVVLTRRPTPNGSDAVTWAPDGSAGPWTAALADADAVVNLAGEHLAAKRWTAARKAVLRSSRILSTRSIVRAIRAATPRPRALLNVSGTGYYGERRDAIVTEATPAGTDFLALLCADWEREAERAADVTRVVRMRNGAVLHPSSGALKEMLLPFRLGIGGPVGSGRQYLPWIHLDDWVALVTWLIEASDAHGAFNLTTPLPTTNAEFSHALGRALRRPAITPVPGFALRALYGEIAGTLLTGQRAIPQRATEMGFSFRFAEIDVALHHLLRR